jgi:hypothetical protein
MGQRPAEGAGLKLAHKLELVLSWPRALRFGLFSLIALSSLALGVEGFGYPGLLPGHNLVRTGPCYHFNPPMLMATIDAGCTVETYADGHVFQRYANGWTTQVWPR